MTRNAFTGSRAQVRASTMGLALALCLGGCGGGDSGSGNDQTQDPAESDDGADSSGDGDGDDGDDDDNADESSGDGDGDGTQDDDDGMIGYDPPDGGAGKDGGPIDIEPPTRNVDCGGSECETTDNRVCCEGWSKETGFGGAMCSSVAACENMYAEWGDNNRKVTSVCDGAEDCSGAQVCCFFIYGTDVWASLIDPTKVGPGAGRMCLALGDCNAEFTLEFGSPTGVVACTQDSDCDDVGGTCQAEQSGSITTGKNGTARQGVKVCR